MNYYPFDSRNLLYREKIGALAEGETLRLRVLLHRDAAVHSVYLVFRNDNSEEAQEALMEPKEWLNDYRFYECSINPCEGLYWYSFRYTSDFGDFKITKTQSSLGIVSSEGEKWQLTVYSKDFSTPDWLSGGIIYQIFPDRFYNSGKIKENVPYDRYICHDWEKQPEFRQTNDLCRLSNDYYGGDLKGIEQKLDYLKDLGISCIYLNPIFEAHSNHRYNTADYFKIDPILGTEQDLCDLIQAAKNKGIEIILDGVFSHTGDDSIYFNKYNRYGSLGAYQSTESPYYNWFDFIEFPNKYKSWWGISILPETKENDLSFSNFITGEDGVIRYWLKKGIKGWRLDVADELPDEFLDKIRLAVKAEGNESFLLGEVWEDASNKVSYGYRRRFLRGRQLDSVMNYPFANAIVDYLKGGKAEQLINTVMDIVENYPPQTLRILMNHIGTHDTARILTRLASDKDYGGNRELESQATLSNEEYEKGISLLKLAAVLQYTLPGVPSVYYGDEAGMLGYGDPFCRATYPWGKENTELIKFYKRLGQIRRSSEVFKEGETVPVKAEGEIFAFMRKSKKQSAFIGVNRGCEEKELNLPDNFKNYKIVFGQTPYENKVVLSPQSFSIVIK